MNRKGKTALKQSSRVTSGGAMLFIKNTFTPKGGDIGPVVIARSITAANHTSLKPRAQTIGTNKGTVIIIMEPTSINMPIIITRTCIKTMMTMGATGTFAANWTKPRLTPV